MSQALRTLGSITDIPAAAWDGLANPAGSPFNPLVSHAFLRALEESGSAAAKTGWAPLHLVLEEDGAITGAAPCYLKSHSMGEYVFDHGWADAFQRAGGSYYPKLQVAVPFTPVTGPRLMAATPERRSRLAHGLVALTRQSGASSVHLTFLPEADWEALGGSGFLQRQDIQFHWHNNGYRTFDDFLASLSSNKRKNIRKERRAVADAGITFEHATGDDLREGHWDHFFACYMDTGSRKWGRPYLNRRFFSLLHETMRQHVLLVLVRRGGKLIAGAINFIGSETLYGRNWGCLEDHPFLHFEACYYQAIDFAIARGLKVVEAGAQGEHKLARGYLPVKTFSLHHFAHKGLAHAVADYLESERAAIDHDQEALAEHSPFRKETP
ncbi:MAG: GNAT family N-acetyltransferase [Proteobacteria bacterium]|nr:GNAT family N-acetyltransferase [Pseudomonadota bacterium]